MPAVPRNADPGNPPEADTDLLLEHRSAYRLSMITTWNMRCLESYFRPKFNMSAAGWRVFSIIGRWEPVFPSQVAQMTTVDADKVTRTVDRLVETNLVDRQTDPDDRRRVIIRLTRRGRAVYEDIEHAARAMEAALMTSLTQPEYEQFHATLTKLEARAKEIFIGRDAWRSIPGLGPTELPARRASRSKKAA